MVARNYNHKSMSSLLHIHTYMLNLLPQTQAQCLQEKQKPTKKDIKIMAST